MKILYIVEYYYPHVGGVETLFQQLAEGMSKKGHQVMVVTASIPGSPKNEMLNGVRVRRIWMPRFGTRYWFTFLSLWYLFLIVPRFQIIHTTTYNAALPALIVGKIFKKKVVVTVHEVWGKLWYRLSGMGSLRAWMHKLFESMMLKLPFDLYIAVSEYTLRTLTNMLPKRACIRIYHGIDEQMFKPEVTQKNPLRKSLGYDDFFTFLYFGRPGWAKGVNLLVEAFSLIRQKYEKTRLVLILSRDPLERYQALRKQVIYLNIDKHVLFLDSLSKELLIQHIIASDCVVIPSLSEGFGFSAAEAAALEVPLVVNKVASLPEVVSGNVIFSEEPNSRSLAHAMEKSLLGDYLKIKKKHFSWENSIHQHQDAYTQLMVS